MKGQEAYWGCLVKDFFRPAEPLLAEAPIVFTRGNHENCSSMGPGRGAAWFRYLTTDPYGHNECFAPPAPPAPLPRETEPVQINAGTLHFVLFDSSSVTPMPESADFDLNQQEANQYTSWFNKVNTLAGNHPGHDYFLITHKPLWMVKRASLTLGVDWTNPTLAKALQQTSRGSLAPNIRLVLSGHEHLYQMLDFNSARPPQVTVGSSGTELDTAPDDTKIAGQTVDRQPIDQSISQDTHGYALLRDRGNQWHLTFHDSNGNQHGKDCALSVGTTKQFSCT
jgi:hypothetical protein